MHQKRKHSHAIGLAGALLMAIIVVGGILAMRDIPAPQQSIEKELDAKTFLNSGQQ